MYGPLAVYCGLLAIIMMDDIENHVSRLDDLGLTMSLLLLQAAQSELMHIDKLNHDMTELLQKKQRNRKYYKKRKFRDEDIFVEPPIFPTWTEICDEISDFIFRKKFRMSKTQFSDLCSEISKSIGIDNFRPEGHCYDFEACGEIRTAIALRMLCGGSYLDMLGRAFAVKSISTVYRFFHEFVESTNKTFTWPLVDLLNGLKQGDPDAIAELRAISAQFASDSNGVFAGCIGAIDGLAIRIKCPSGEKDPGNYFCRKNFYALNVQAICDKTKRIMWISPGHNGASHDSSAWSVTKLCKLLQEMEGILKEYGFYLVGDSAYPLCPFLLVPYSDADPGSAQDSFNFWLSNSRIQIECTFGELIMRFGLFWRTLRFDHNKCVHIIRAAALVHNFLVSHREGTDLDKPFFKNLSREDMKESKENCKDSSDEKVVPLVSDNNEPKPRGRKFNADIERQKEGKRIRMNVCTDLAENGLARPVTNRMKVNALGNVYFD